MVKISVVIPTKNEASSIEEIVDGLKKWAQERSYSLEILITDDSHDDTRLIARRLGVGVVIGKGKGLGLAMYRGLKASIVNNPNVVLAIDGDGQVDLTELDSFIKPILENRAELVLGSRFLNKNLVAYKYRWINRFGVFILVQILRKLTRLDLTDSHGGLRAMTPEVIEHLELIGSHTYVQETIIDAHENGFKIIEIPSKWLVRKEGESRVVLSIPKYIFYTLPVLILRSGQHIRLLFPIGILFIMASFFDFIYVLFATHFSLQSLFDRHSFHLIFILLIIGINFFFFGFTLELISQIKRRQI